MKKLYPIILALVVLGTAGYIWIRNNNTGEVRYRTERVSRGDVVLQVRATGTIKPVQTVQVGSQVSGTLSEMHVDFNSEVKKGQVIALIDPTFLNASVKEAEANRERNQAQANEARRNLDRVVELFKKDLVSQADLDAATASSESAQAQLKQSDAAVERARVNLRFATIRAPIDGVVISRDVDVGQTVAASLQAPKLFEIANDLREMRVEASVDEADIGQIREGQPVSFTVDSYPEEQFRGRVTQVRLAPVTVQNVVTYTVIIDVPNPDLKLRPGMTATVSILIDRRTEVLRVPTLALRFQPPAEVLERLQKSMAEENAGRGEHQEKGDAEVARPGDDLAEQAQAKSDSVRRVGRGDRAMSDESRARWRERMIERGGPGGRESMRQRPSKNQNARVWILEGERTLTPLSIRTGLNDSRYVEIGGGDLKEGDEIVIGSISGEVASIGPAQQTNPFQPRMPGSGGGRRGF